MSTSQPAPPTAPQNAPAAQDPPPFEAVPPPRSAVADREKLSPKSIGVVVVAAAAVMVAGIIANGGEPAPVRQAEAPVQLASSTPFPGVPAPETPTPTALTQLQPPRREPFPNQPAPQPEADGGVMTYVASAAPSRPVGEASVTEGAARAGAASGPSELAGRMRPTPFRPVGATVLPHQELLLTRGTPIECKTREAIDTTYPGIVTCFLTHEVRGKTGTVVLMERDTKLVGEVGGGMRQGDKRVFVLWNRAETPHGVVADLDSPGTDDLGRTGVAGEVDNHWGQRFGNALLFSLLGDGVRAGGAALGPSGSVYLQDTQSAGTGAAGEILRQSANIPPTLTRDAGLTMRVMIARDVDFSPAYELRMRDARWTARGAAR